jgi:hypothetical protein
MELFPSFILELVAKHLISSEQHFPVTIGFFLIQKALVVSNFNSFPSECTLAQCCSNNATNE